MHITVEQALSIYPLSEGKLIAGNTGTSRIVKSVNVMDAPDITDWIKDGEMLFTTAYLMKDNPEGAIQLLRTLDKRGSAGLGIKLGRFWTRIPEPIVEEANRLKFPLIELPYQFTFSDQMNGLFQAELQRSTKVLHTVLDKQKKLMQFALKPDQVNSFFHTVAGIIGYPMAVIGSRGHIVFNSTPLEEPLLLRNWPWKDHYQWVYTEEGRFFRIPLFQKEECIGYAIFHPTDAALMKVEEGLFHQAAEIISYHMGFIYKDYLEHSLQNDLGSLFLRYLRSSVPIETLTDYAEGLGIQLFNGSYQCVLTTVSPLAEARRREKMLREIREELQYHPVLKELPVIHFYVEEGIFSLFPSDSFQNGHKLEVILEKCISSMAGNGVEAGPRLFLSTKKMKPQLLAEAYRECVETKQMAERLEIHSLVLKFETIEFAYLFQHVPPAGMKAYSDQVLRPLLEKDPEYAQEMLRTLETFIENDGQVNETAKLLFIHRNTATYRLEKISEMLQVDFKKVNDLLRLKLVFLFRQMG
ncbi:PucR family transcriptional regulator [Paenibacillus rigui]|uniref:PucR family transcriptional regulator n=1 Tax=Paenibacillus rigui TaxID=554312 RepID=A0A229UX98_9BACL|nr:PucR family transcriptional regulator [Paenibacillus rigui]OXM87775.1 PucR family transcriptional regulator [Paenibacillus rigui]